MWLRYGHSQISQFSPCTASPSGSCGERFRVEAAAPPRSPSVRTASQSSSWFSCVWRRERIAAPSPSIRSGPAAARQGPQRRAERAPVWPLRDRRRRDSSPLAAGCGAAPASRAPPRRAAGGTKLALPPVTEGEPKCKASRRTLGPLRFVGQDATSAKNGRTVVKAEFLRARYQYRTRTLLVAVTVRFHVGPGNCRHRQPLHATIQC